MEMTINFYYPTLELFCFSFTQPFLQNIVLFTQPFSLRCYRPPLIMTPFVETPRKLITAKLSIRKPGSSSVLII
jgi:hypothetical protein